MYLHMTMVKMIPDKVREACQKWISHERQTDQIQGIHQWLLIESLDEPGQITWLSLWDSQGEARTFLTSLAYAEQVAALQPYLLSAPQWYGYNVLESVLFEPG
jgi:quinol monooxygenase YgiN